MNDSLPERRHARSQDEHDSTPHSAIFDLVAKIRIAEASVLLVTGHALVARLLVGS
jgi:hypothetical protein